jgi:hypothetical protein
VISDRVDGATATWTDGGKIAFVDHDGYGWLPEAGGTVHRLNLARIFPYVTALPNDRVIVSTVDGRICVVSLRDSSVHYLTMGKPSNGPPPLDQALLGVWARYVGGRFLVFWRPGAITYAVRFNEKSLTVDGPPVEVKRGTRVAFTAVSPAGVLAYAPDVGAGVKQLAELGPHGIVRTLPVRARRYSEIALSRDARRLALRVSSESGSDELAVHDLTKPDAPLTDRLPIGRGTSVIWDRSGRYLYADSVDGTVYRRDLKTGALDSVRVSKAGDEEFLLDDVIGVDTLVVDIGRFNAHMVYRIPFHEPARRIPALSTASKDQSVWGLSPDAKWLVYQAKNGSNYDFYLTRGGSPDQGVRLEDVGGGFRWGRDGQLYFVRGDSILRTRVQDRPNGPEVSTQTATFVTRFSLLDPETWAYTPTGDGSSILAFIPPRAGPARHLTVVRRWDRELARKVP